MSIVEIKDGTLAKPVPEPTVYDPGYKHSIVESVYTPQTGLLSNVSGTPVLCEYYRTAQGASEEQIGLQLDDLSTYQSYTRIRNLILKFQGEEAFSFDEAVAEASKTVTAYALFDLVPLMGDVFITDIGDGQAGLYQINGNPRIATINADKVYEFDCLLLGLVTKEIADNLNSKVIKELVYSKDSALHGGNALLAKEDFDINRTLDTQMRSIARYYLSKFYWEPEATICLPVPTVIGDREFTYVYDQYLVEFVTNVFPMRMLGYMKPVSRLEVAGYMHHGKNFQVTVWDLFKRCDWSILPSLKPTMWIKDRRDFFGTRMGSTFNDSKFDGAIINDEKAYESVLPPYYGYLYNGQYKTAGTFELPSYIFTEKFYQGSYGNEFEKLLVDVFRDNLVDKKAILAECERFYNRSPEEQVYYGALLVGIIVKSRISNAGYL